MNENTTQQNISVPHEFSLENFSKSQKKMIATNDSTYKFRGDYWRQLSRLRTYSQENISQIIQSGSLSEQQQLSRHYFDTQGYYSQIIIHYGTLLNYTGLLIPNPSHGKSLSTSHIAKRYYSALDYVEKMQLSTFLTNCAIRALVDGCYYGVVTESDKSTFTTIDLPLSYCRTRFKDGEGNDIIEFNLAFFESITNESEKKSALLAYPKVISKAYKHWSVKKGSISQWFIIPSDIGICFPGITGCRPPFLGVIPATLNYDEAVATNREKDQEEIRKIIVQKIPHLSDGRLLFEPEEALEIHQGTVGMMKGNENVSVLTTYADVDSIVSKAASDDAYENLERMERNIYSQAGVSNEIFTSSGSSTLDASLRNDLAYMMYFGNKFSNYVTNLLNRKFSNGNITFKYTILPISWHNYDKFADASFKLVGSGYSFLMPALAMGLSQRDFGNIKDLENDVLKLGEKMIPPSTSYTQTEPGKGGEEPSKEGDSKKAADGKPVKTDTSEGGRPKKEDGEKADTTIKKEKSQK